MKVKLSQYLLYLFWSLISTGAYGLFAYYGIYRGLAGGSLIGVYLWNIVFIVIFLLFDKLASSTLLSEKLKISERNYFISAVIFSLNIISFKTTLYLFYTFILIVSRVSIFEPELFADSFTDFVLSIEYTLILLVAIDKFNEHLNKDNNRVKRITSKFERFADYVKKRKRKES